MHRKLLLALAALCLAAVPLAALGQPSQRSASALMQEAAALAAQIHRFHSDPGAWRGYSPPPPDYCRVMTGGELVLKELAAIASKTVLYGPPGIVLPLQRAGDALSDALDQEEEINNQAGFDYAPYPCPTPSSPFTARAGILVLVNQRMPECRVKANALRLSFAARRNMMQQCLRVRM
jgi:hypothetical protein